MSIIALPTAWGLSQQPGLGLLAVAGAVPALPGPSPVTMHGTGAAQATAHTDTRVARVVGTVKARIDANTQAPLARLVRLHCQATGRLVGQTWSTPAGDYSFDRVPAGRYIVLSVDHMGQWAGVLESDVLVRLPPAQWAHQLGRYEPNLRVITVPVFVRDRTPVFGGGGGGGGGF